MPKVKDTPPNQEGKRLWLLTARQDNNLVGIAPLMLSSQKKHGMSFRLLQTLGTPNTDQSDFIALNNDPEIVMQFCNYILTQKNAWDAIELNEHKADNSIHCEVRMSNGKIGKMPHQIGKFERFGSTL